MPSPYRSIFKSLVERDLLLPYFRNAVLGDNWPESYQITIDSSPYYGKDDGYFHPSTHGQLGARLLYYMFHPAHKDRLVFEPRSVQDEMTLAMGSALHGVVQTQFHMAGMLEPKDIEVEYIIRAHHVRGRIDMIVDHPIGDRIPVEFKTQNSRAYDFQKDIKDIWDMQLSMALFGVDLPYGVLLVLESGYPYRMREYRVTRNDALLTEIFDKFDHVRESIALDRPPEHCCAKGSAEMKKCPARFECWLAKEVKTDVA